MSIQPQSQLKDKIQQNAMDEKKQKKVIQNGHKRKLMENERDKQKAELESSKNELKSLMSQYGTKAKVADDLERDSTLIRGNIESLLARVRSNKISKPISQSTILPPPSPPSPPPQSQQVIMKPKATDFPLNILNTIITAILLPFDIVLNIIRRLFRGINNCTVILAFILLIECFILLLIWAVKKSHHTYLYIEPYEPVVHGTFGVDQPASLGIMWSIVNSVKDFFAEVINGGRGFGNPNYDGFVPI